jgi:opacity protein-like surface antigen
VVKHAVLLAAAALGSAGTVSAQDTSMVQGGIYQRPFIVSVGRTAVGGYAEGNANYLVTDGVGEGWSMELRRFNVFLFSSVGRRLRFISELEFEHGTEEIALETALIDFVVNPSLVLRAGILLPPIGAFNVNHDSPRYDFVERPLVSTRVIPATLSEIGFGVHGRLAPRGFTLSYDAYLTNGLGEGVVLNQTGRTDLQSGKTEERFAEDNNGSPSLTGRLAAQHRSLGEVGLSFYGGPYNTYSIEGTPVDAKRWLSIVALDFNTTLGALDVRGEAALAAIDVPPDLRELMAERQWGIHVDLVLPVWRPQVRALESAVVSAVLRLERIDLNRGRFVSTGLPIRDETSAFTAGLSFRPAPGTVFRANYRYESFRDPQGNPASKTAGFQLGFATYF